MPEKKQRIKIDLLWVANIWTAVASISNFVSISVLLVSVRHHFAVVNIVGDA